MIMGDWNQQNLLVPDRAAVGEQPRMGILLKTGIPTSLSISCASL
jgi:hypothetical protein